MIHLYDVYNVDDVGLGKKKSKKFLSILLFFTINILHITM